MITIIIKMSMEGDGLPGRPPVVTHRPLHRAGVQADGRCKKKPLDEGL
jgi:hypothetical protein